LLPQLAVPSAAVVFVVVRLTSAVKTAMHKLLSVLTSVQKVDYLVRHAAMHSGAINSVAKIEFTGLVVVVMTLERIVLVLLVAMKWFLEDQDSSEHIIHQLSVGQKRVYLTQHV
jgi:hypothetical protein